MLKVKLLRSGAKAPTIAHPGEDLGYDIYAAENITIPARGHAVVPTAIAIELTGPGGEPLGALLRDKSSMGARRLTLTGGVIDAGYRGEIILLMENLGDEPYVIRKGDKIAQLLEHPFLAGEVVESDLTEAARGAEGFGSTGN